MTNFSQSASEILANPEAAKAVLTMYLPTSVHRYIDIYIRSMVDLVSDPTFNTMELTFDFLVHSENFEEEMVVLDEQENWTMTLSQLHNVLVKGISANTKDGLVRVQEFILDSEGSAIPEMVTIVESLNRIQQDLALLDSNFHDVFDGKYC